MLSSALGLRVASMLASGMRALPSSGRFFPPGLAADPSAYECVRIADTLGYGSSPWSHRTIARLPREERYPLAMQLSKSIVMASLAAPIGERKERSSSEIEAIHWVLGAPELARAGHPDDLTFARLRLQGPNAGWIQELRGDQRDRLGLAPASVPEAGRAYVVSYLELLRDLPLRSGRFVAPCAAIFVERGAGLVPYAIELEREDRTRFRSRPGEGWAWELAKRFVQSADVLVHEVVSHYLFTHVVGEQFLLATARRLPIGHPVRRWLSPHFAYTLQANANSGRRLLGSGGVFDRVFAPGWSGALVLLERGEELWRWERLDLPRHSRARQVSACPGYAYHDDGIELHRAIEGYARDFVLGAYGDDASVRRDDALRGWRAELAEFLPRAGLPELSSRQELASMLTGIVFSVVEHTLVNALQYSAFGGPECFPTSLHVRVPRDGDRVDAALFEGAMPDRHEALEAIRAAYAFSIQYTRLSFPCTSPERATLRQRLMELDHRIRARDRSRSVPYVISRPRAISDSINA